MSLSTPSAFILKKSYYEYYARPNKKLASPIVAYNKHATYPNYHDLVY